MKIGMLAGEASGDILGAGLLKELQKLQPDIECAGIGGPQMIAAGCQSLFEMDRLSVMGLVEPLFRLRELFKIRSSLYRYFTTHKPKVFIGIDSPDFNIGLEGKLKRAGIPTVHYVSPSVWAWRQKRIFKIAKATDLVLTLLPFEADFYKKHNVPVCYVGHPLADMIPLHPDRKAARHALGLDPEATYIAVLPGSRQNELKYLGEVFAKTAKICWQKRSDLRFITSAINEKRDLEFQAICRKIAPNLPITFIRKQSHEVLAAADAVLVTSGTATLETMLYKRPMVVAYRMSSLTYQLAKRLVKIKFMSLPNLLANEALVPEFIQHAATPAAMSEALLNYIANHDLVRALENRFTELHLKLRCDANKRAAEAVMTLLPVAMPFN